MSFVDGYRRTWALWFAFVFTLCNEPRTLQPLMELHKEGSATNEATRSILDMKVVEELLPGGDLQAPPHTRRLRGNWRQPTLSCPHVPGGGEWGGDLAVPLIIVLSPLLRL